MLDKPLTTLTAADTRIRQLANAMFELLATNGECTRSLLRSEGFSNHELDNYGVAAKLLADKRFVRNDSVDDGVLSDDDLMARALVRCNGLITEGQIIAALREMNFAPAQIARLWDRLMPRLAHSIGISVAKMPLPSSATMRAFA